jgi:cobalt-zinc-cadmium efflux system outer membrane protein
MYARYVIFALALCCLSLANAPVEALSRRDAILIALEANPEVTAAEKAWEAAQARSRQARALPDPELELEYEELPGVTRFGDFGSRAFGATQRIESPLKWWRRSSAARQAAEAVHLGLLEMTRLDISSRVKVAYDRVLFNQKKLEYIQQNLQLAQDFLEKAQLRLEAGDVSQLEVLRAEVEAGRAANRLSSIRNELAIARAELNTLLVRESVAVSEIDGALDFEPVTLALKPLQQSALEQRPDLLGAEWALASAHSERGLARAALLPDLNIGLFRQTIQDTGGKDDLWRVGLSLEFPLWGAARQRGLLAEANASVGQVTAEQSALRYRVLLEVESAFLEVQTSALQVRLYQDRIVRVAERSFEVASRSYAEGKATYLELLEAQRALTGVREEYAGALFSHRTAVADLERAVGDESILEHRENE